jgi:hypothetical protein
MRGVAGSQYGSHWHERLSARANEYGQTGGSHARPQTNRDDAERLTGTDGSEGWSFMVMLACPKISGNIFGGYPAWIIREAAVCHRS